MPTPTRAGSARSRSSADITLVRHHARPAGAFVTLRSIAALDDVQLVAAAQRGDRAALDQLLRRHYDRIHAVCRRITGSASEADDACQEALIKIVRSLPRFDGRSTFATWAYRIATNASLDELRRRKRRPSLHAVDDAALTDVVDEAASRRVGRIDDQLAIDDALGTLSDDFRVVIVLRDVVDLDYQEIADRPRPAARHRQVEDRPGPGPTRRRAPAGRTATPATDPILRRSRELGPTVPERPNQTPMTDDPTSLASAYLDGDLTPPIAPGWSRLRSCSPRSTGCAQVRAVLADLARRCRSRPASATWPRRSTPGSGCPTRSGPERSAMPHRPASTPRPWPERRRCRRRLERRRGAPDDAAGTPACGSARLPPAS